MKILMAAALAAVLCMALAFTALAADANLIMSWSFDGETVAEDTGAADAVAVGDVAFSDGVFGKCLTLNGTDACVPVTYSGEDFYFDAVTVTYWVNVEYLTFNYTGLLVGEYAKPGDISNHVANDTFFSFDMCQVGVSEIKSEIAVDENTWYFVALEYDSNGTFKIYVNGELQGEGDGGYDPVALDYFTIGAWISNREDTSSASRFLQGSMDEIRLYDRLLTDDEIKNVMTYNTIAGDAPVEEAPVEEAPVEEAVVEAPVEEAVEEAPVAEAPVTAPQTVDLFTLLFALCAAAAMSIALTKKIAQR